MRRPAGRSGSSDGGATAAVVGAGIAGLVAARTLRGQGLRVVVFDKGRRAGGRANTRQHGEHRFDHGAQFFTVRHPTMRKQLEAWLHDGVVMEWSGSLVRVEGGRMEAAWPTRRYVGVPGMIALAGSLAAGLDVRTGVRIETLDGEPGSWVLTDPHGEAHGPFAHVVVAVPAPQAVPLLAVAPGLRTYAETVEMRPCWAGMFVFEERPALDFDAAFLADGALSWIARDASKPARPERESWVLHGSPDWTAAHWDVPRDDIPALMLEELRGRFGPHPAVTFQRAHRWGFALASEVSSRGAHVDRGLGLAVCGDWCFGGRIEGAFLSGAACAGRLLGASEDDDLLREYPIAVRSGGDASFRPG